MKEDLLAHDVHSWHGGMGETVQADRVLALDSKSVARVGLQQGLQFPLQEVELEHPVGIAVERVSSAII